MHVNIMNKQDFLSLVFSQKELFLQKINTPEVFVVKNFYESQTILNFRHASFELGQQTKADWHPLFDNCPDYHRLHDNYPGAYVQAKFHAFYAHGWYKENREKFNYFQEIFAIKNFLAGLPAESFLTNIPSDSMIARVNIHHYPVGGGYQAEHIDPVSRYNAVQTIIQASHPGKDFQCGGVYGRINLESEKFFIDPFTTPGDLIVMSPGIPHGVAPVDPEQPYQSDSNNGRWMIMPIIVASDYPNPTTIKPKQVTLTENEKLLC